MTEYLRWCQQTARIAQTKQSDYILFIEQDCYRIGKVVDSVGWLPHRFPLYYIAVPVSWRAASILLKILKSENFNFTKQFTHVSIQPGA